MIRILGKAEIAEHWETIEPLLARVLDRFDYGSNASDLLLDFMNEERQLWSINDLDAIAVTQISKLPRFSVLDVPLMAGSGMKEWMDDLVQTLREHAREQGCKYMDGFGRKGWTKRLHRYGFKPYSYDVRLEV